MNEYFSKKGSRLEANKAIVSLQKNGQYKTTIPKAIANAAGLKKGSVLKFKLNTRKTISMKEEVDEDAKDR